jgi:hypothetical protein
METVDSAPFQMVTPGRHVGRRVKSGTLVWPRDRGRRGKRQKQRNQNDEEALHHRVFLAGDGDFVIVANVRNVGADPLVSTIFGDFATFALRGLTFATSLQSSSNM